MTVGPLKTFCAEMRGHGLAMRVGFLWARPRTMKTKEVPVDNVLAIISMVNLGLSEVEVQEVDDHTDALMFFVEDGWSICVSRGSGSRVLHIYSPGDSYTEFDIDADETVRRRIDAAWNEAMTIYRSCWLVDS